MKDSGQLLYHFKDAISG